MAGHRQVERLPAEQYGRAFIDQENDTEGGQHLLDVVARIEAADHHKLDDQTGKPGCCETSERGERIRAGALANQRGAIGADHVKGAVRQVDDAHDAEDQRQPGRQQKEHDAELNAVQRLLKRQIHGFAAWVGSPAGPYSLQSLA